MPVRMSALGNVLVIAGGVVGVATVAAVATGTEITLTPAMIQLLVYKGLAAAALGLIVVGSWVGRRARQQERDKLGLDTSKSELASGASSPFKDSNNATRPAADEVKLPNSN